LKQRKYFIIAILIIFFGLVSKTFPGQTLPQQYSFEAPESHTPEEIRYLEMCDSWLGSDINELIIKWGVPTKIIRGEDGQIFIYKTFKDFVIKQFFCTTQFSTNPKGEIISFNVKGDGCWEPDRWIGK